jgi:integrase
MSQRALVIFEQAIKSEHTKKLYTYHLEKFRKWTNIKTIEGLTQFTGKEVQILLEDYVMYLKKSLSPNTIPTYFSPIELFYVMNDFNINYKKIRKLFPTKVKSGNARGYTRKEIQAVINYARTKRNKALVLLMASSGVRIGAICDIRIKHLSKIENSYSIMIYPGEKEEDYIFTTPEATKSIDDYLEERKKDGEYLDENSPLFRNVYQFGIQKVIPIKTESVTHVMGRLISVVDRKKTGKTNRFDVAKNHGFRKFYATIVKSTIGITSTMSEKLINHVGVVQMDGSYFTPTKEMMFEAYKKAIPELIINDMNRVQVEKKQVEAKQILLDKQQEEIEILKLKVERMISTIQK